MNRILPEDIGKRITLHANQKFAVFAIRTYLEPGPIYVGWCRRSMLFDLSPLETVAGFPAEIERTQGVLILEILGFYETRDNAAAALTAHRAALRPKLNGVATGRGVVRCLDDNRSYPNSAQAAKAYGIHPSAMSNHLRGRKGYESVHGKRFIREYAVAPRSVLLQYRDKRDGVFYPMINGAHATPQPMPQRPDWTEEDRIESELQQERIMRSEMEHIRKAFKDE